MKNVISLLLYLMLIDLFFSNFSLCAAWSSDGCNDTSKNIPLQQTGSYW